MQTNCIVIMSNNVEYNIEESIKTITEIRTIGQYNNDIVFMYGDDLVDIINDKNNDYAINLDKLEVITKYFKTIDRSKFIDMFKNKSFTKGDKREINKSFQYHKFYLFTEYFKKWNKIFYIDAGMHIFKPIQPMLNIDCTNKLLAHSDTFPYFKGKLNSQFEDIAYPEIYNKLNNNYNLKVDYFQTEILLFDSKIISPNIFDDLVKLSEEYFISITNEQGIMNLLFNCKLRLWRQIPLKDDNTYYYDMCERPKRNKNDYIMLKII